MCVHVCACACVHALCVHVCVCARICMCSRARVCVHVCARVRLCSYTYAGELKISLAGAINSVPTTGLTPYIMIIHVIIVPLKKTSMPAAIPWCHEWCHSTNSIPLHMCHVYVCVCVCVCTCVCVCVCVCVYMYTCVCVFMEEKTLSV